MIIKYEFVCDKTALYIPDNVQWEIFTRRVNGEGYEDYGLYLLVDGVERMLADVDKWRDGTNIPKEAISDMHEEVIDVIVQKISNDPNLQVLDIESIIDELIFQKYEKIWVERGYIKLAPDGSW